MTTNKTNVVYAVFADGNFKSWLYGAFCQLVDIPKIYGYNGTDSQTDIVMKNLSYKLFSGESSHLFGSYVYNEQVKEKEILNQSSEFHLGVFYLNEDELKDDSIFEQLKTQSPNKLIAIIPNE